MVLWFWLMKSLEYNIFRCGAVPRTVLIKHTKNTETKKKKRTPKVDGFLTMTKPRLSNLSEQKLPSDYKPFVKELKERILHARLKASLAVNAEMLLLYYGIALDLDVKTTKAFTVHILLIKNL
jgi:hypothetical protein